jgi:hypothetical protein
MHTNDSIVIEEEEEIDSLQEAIDELSLFINDMGEPDDES